ncbi:hypothetical protein [Cohnella candidum]|nr:hypothetical protein [Cohnella candidum]
MDQTTYEIQYNEGYTVRMISGNESMEPLDFDKAAFQAVLADIVLRAKEEPASVQATEDLWQWACTELGLALQRTIMAEDGVSDPLDTLIHTAFRVKSMKAAEDAEQEEREEREEPISPVYLLEHLLSYIHQDDQIESVMYVARMNDGTITSGWTDLAYTEAIGLLEIGKLQVVKEMWSEWEPGNKENE